MGIQCVSWLGRPGHSINPRHTHPKKIDQPFASTDCSSPKLGALPKSYTSIAMTTNEAMKKTIVLYPGLAVSHFVPMMELADALLEHGYAVTVALIDPTLKEDIAFAATVDRVASSKPSVSFHRFPRIQNPPTIIHDELFILRYLDLVGRYERHLHDFLCSMPPRRVHAVVIDSMSFGALDVAKKLNIPSYIFQPVNASVFSAVLQLPSVRAQLQPSLKELGDTSIEFSGLPPMPVSHLGVEVLDDPESEIYKAFINMWHRGSESSGILVNTFESLETRAVRALSDPHSLHGLVLPPVYCVGPLFNKASDTKERAEKHECLAWLDGQPQRSVVFLCFGSVGAGNHSEEQLKEIAVGLEQSGHRFLWVVRAPLSDDPEKTFDPRADPDLDALLPAGFLERTNGRGLVVKLWAPQVDVLHHRATGAFVTHCGWNSVLEGIMAGVPMLCWPLYAEQKINKVLMVEEMRIAVEMVGWQQGLVKAKEVEAKVRLVIESEEGRELRARVVAHKEGAAMAWKDGGSSRAAFARFLSDVDSLAIGHTSI